MFVTWFQINYRKMSFNCPWKMYINTASKDLIELNCQLINHWIKLGVTCAHCAFFFKLNDRNQCNDILRINVIVYMRLYKIKKKKKKKHRRQCFTVLEFLLKKGMKTC